MNPWVIGLCQDFHEYFCGDWIDNNHIQQEEYFNRLVRENRVISEVDLKSVITRVYEDSMVTVRKSLGKIEISFYVCSRDNNITFLIYF